MGAQHPIAMASGIMPEATPVQLIEAAAFGGFDFGGMWFEPELWTSQTTRDVRRAMEATGVRLLDIEVVWLKPGPPDPEHARLVEVGAELGARNVLCVSSDPDMAATQAKLAALMELGERLNIRINLEFGLFTEVKTLAQARGIVEGIGSKAGGVLVDSLHLQRSGGTPADVAAIPSSLMSYIQLCDAAKAFPGEKTFEAIIEEAIDHRMPMGTGGLPLWEIIAALTDGFPIAIEERSKPLRDNFPDLNARAKECRRTIKAFFDREI